LQLAEDVNERGVAGTSYPEAAVANYVVATEDFRNGGVHVIRVGAKLNQER
jgi:hypothetical protein